MKTFGRVIEMTIKLQLKNVIHSDKICEKLGINTWCVNEGADGDEWIEIEYQDFKDNEQDFAWRLK